VSHVTCEKCNGNQAHCTKCNRPWSLDLSSKHRCHFNGRPTQARWRRACDGRHRDFKCDRCGLIAEGRPPERGSKYALLPQGWARATTPGAGFSNLDLCGSCYPRFAIAHDAAVGDGDASRLDEAINRVESIACGWAFDLGVKWPRTVSRSLAGEILLIDTTSFESTALEFSAVRPVTASQQIEQEDGEYNREEYR
jgi:hypothetical protein